MNLFPKIANRLINVREAFNGLENNKGWSLSEYVKPIWKVTPPGQSLEVGAKKILGKKRYFTHRKLHFNRPASTIHKSRGSLIYHPSLPRGISIEELKRLGSFPKDFKLLGGETTKWNLIGNSVPPLFMYSIAGTIRERLFGNYIMPNRNGNEYLDILEAAWQDHLKPKEPDAPTVISLFAGCGGSSLGYSMAGYRELLAVEWDDNAVATFKLNFPDVPVYHGDIHNLSVDECLELTGLEPEELDLLDGSPPCQGFSTAGKRQMDDQRNQLYMEYVRLLRSLRPKVFVMENVSGLVKGKMKLIFADIMRELKASGYDVKCRLMNTMYFNVPQSRQRLIWIGVRKDLGVEAGHPKGKGSPIFVSDVLPCVESIRSYSQGYQIKWLNSNRPHPTLQQDPSQKATRWLINETEHRPTTKELSLIASFVTAFDFSGNDNDAWRCIGNSVPPLFIKGIAQHIRQEILGL